MKKTAFLSLLFATSLSVHAETTARSTDNTIDRRVEVAYTCQGGDNQTVPLTAMYGIKENDVIVAQVKLGGQISPGMWRVADALLNRFISQDDTAHTTMWTTLPATADNLTQVNGGILSFAEDENSPHTIIVENCRLDKVATAKLNQN